MVPVSPPPSPVGESSLSHCRFASIPRSLGIEPVRWLFCANSRLRLVMPPSPISIPVNSFRCTLRMLRFVRPPSAPGTMPSRLFSFRFSSVSSLS